MQRASILVLVWACGGKADDQPSIAVPPTRAIDWGGPSIDCTKLLTPEDVHATCRRTVLAVWNALEGGPWDTGSNTGGEASKVCVRTFKFSEEDPYDSISLEVTAYKTDAFAARVFPPDVGGTPIVGTSAKEHALGALHMIAATHGRLVTTVNWNARAPGCGDAPGLYRLAERRIDEALAKQ